MFIDFSIAKGPSSVGATCAGNQAYMPLLRSWVCLVGGFYKHVAPTALKQSWRDLEVFQQAAKDLEASLRVTFPEQKSGTCFLIFLSQ